MYIIWVKKSKCVNHEIGSQMLNDERIQNLASEFKSNNILPPFWPKHCQKLARYPILPILTIFGLKGGQSASER